mgnify:FL=1
MGVTFTKEQQQVIDLRNRNLLVSAAAGSGKTAVLVERIIQMILNKEHPVDIDRLLVVTFTNAAAAEMRERIRQAIDRELAVDPFNGHLQKQAALLHKAQITTIDSFCLFVIHNHFHEIGLDPGFRVADEGELKLLQQDTLNELLEQEYDAADPKFLQCVEYFTGGSNDRLLLQYIEKLHDFAESYPWPEDWLLGCMEDYKAADVEELNGTQWCRYLTSHVCFMLQELAGKLRQACRLSERPAGPYMYGELLEKEAEMLEQASMKETYQEQYEIMEKITFGRLPSKKDDSVDPALRAMAQQLRNEVKKQIEKLKGDFLLRSPEQALAQMHRAYPMVEELISLVLTYERMLTQKKREANMIDFGDMEHLALQILLTREDGEIVPTRAAKEYRECFDEILIDEYQDSNLVQEYLLMAVSGEQDGRNNRFMVGDVKQSIYKFRLARPELFMEKYHTYTKEESGCQRIDLHKNFRSRREVLEGVNTLFQKIMGQELGGIVYDEDAALYEGASYPENTGNDTEYLIFTQEEESGESVRSFEARAIAAKIRTLYQSFQVTDKETGALRPVQYRDMVILLRTNSGWAQEFKETLQKEGIPAYVSLRTGYFEASEIRELLQFLHVIDNPRQDIPLYGMMKSYFGGFGEEEIAGIRAGVTDKKIEGKASEDKDKAGENTSEENTVVGDDSAEAVVAAGKPVALIDQLRAYDGDLKEKIADFLTILEHYRQMSVYTPIHKLLEALIYTTGYFQYVTAKPGGEQRRANVEMLLSKAVAFEQTSFYGVFHFLRYIEQLSKYEVDYGEADILDENADVVRIMSIHKSKGLEFPVCFVAGLSKKFNMQDTTGRLVTDMDLGMGVDEIDSELRIQRRMTKKNVVSLKMRLDTLAEEMRVLYVAMTRAREKLILTAVVRDGEKLREQIALYENTKAEDGRMRFTDLLNAGSFLQFVLPALSDAQFISEGELKEQEISGECGQLLKREQFMYRITREEASEEELAQKEKLRQRMDRRYADEGLKELVTKTSVSELKKAQMDLDFAGELFPEKEIVPYIPAFMQEEQGMSGADRGSAYHRVMELLDFEKVLEAKAQIQEQNQEWKQNQEQDQSQKEKHNEENNKEMNREENRSKKSEKSEADTYMILELERQIALMVEKELLQKPWSEAVSVKKLVIFFQSSLAQRMAEAQHLQKLKKEQPFVLGIAADRVKPQFPHEEQVLIQGIIDAFFEEGDDLILMDYKTDAVKTGEELVKRYHTQMEYYTEALERIVGKKVKERIIYSFALGEEIRM